MIVDEGQPSSFGWRPPLQITQECEAILNDTSTSLETIFQNCHEILQFFNENDYTVTNRLILSFDEITELFLSTNERAILIMIKSLFLSKNTSLLELLLDPNSIDFVSKIIQGTNLFKIGIATQIISSGLDKWPANLMSSIYQSSDFFHSVLISIDKPSVHLLVECLIRQICVSTPSFLWGFYVSLMHNENIKIIPKKWDISYRSISKCYDVNLDLEQRLLLYRIFYTFMTLYPNETEFKDIIYNSLPILLTNSESYEEQAEILNFAINFPEQEMFIDTAIKLATVENMNTDITEKAISYLSLHMNSIPIGKIIHILYLLINKSQPNNFVYRVAANLIEEAVEHHSESALFIKATQNVIAYAWNHPPFQSLMFRSFIIGYSTIFGPRCSFPGWSIFYMEVVCPFSKRVGITSQYQFDESQLNISMLNEIQKGTVDLSQFKKNPHRNSFNVTNSSTEPIPTNIKRRHRKKSKSNLDIGTVVENDNLIEGKTKETPKKEVEEQNPPIQEIAHTSIHHSATLKPTIPIIINDTLPHPNASRTTASCVILPTLTVQASPPVFRPVAKKPVKTKGPSNHKISNKSTPPAPSHKMTSSKQSKNKSDRLVIKLKPRSNTPQPMSKRDPSLVGNDESDDDMNDDRKHKGCTIA